MDIKKIITLALTVLVTIQTYSTNKDPDRYIFLQQVNPMCMIAPVINLYLVEKFTRNGYDVGSLPSFNRREWFAKEVKPLVNWHRAFNNLNISPDKYVHLNNFIDDVIQHGPIFPHFYDKYGNFAFKGFRGAMNCEFTPLALIDYNDLSNKKLTVCGLTIESLDHIAPPLGLQLPLGCNADGSYKKYQEIYGGSVICTTLMPGYSAEEELCRAYGLMGSESACNTILQEKKLGLKPTLLCNFGTGISRSGRCYIPYLVGMYSLMLMTIGIDTHNNPVQQDSPDYYAYQDLKNLMETTDNPWNSCSFSRDNFLQYQLAEVLKNNPELLNEAEQTLDFYFYPWETYNNLRNGNYYRKITDSLKKTVNYVPYNIEQISRFIPGKEQAMGYYLSCLARMLWYGACSTNGKVFYNNAHSCKIPFFFSFEGFKAGAQKQKKIIALDGTTYQSSYIMTWNKLINKLKFRWFEKGIKRLNWVSFDDHGWVCSFDQNIIDLQNKVPGVDVDLLKELKFACIDSWQGTDLNVFYKVNESQALNKKYPNHPQYKLIRYDE